MNWAAMVKSAERTLLILEEVCAHKNGLTQKELSELLGIPKSSLSAILNDLTATEYVRLDPLKKLYTIGPQILTLAGRYLDNLDVVGRGRPLVMELARKTGESGVLAIPVGWEALLVYKEDCVQPILPSIQVGTRFPMNASAVGKAMLANFPEDEQERFLLSADFMALTPQTPTDPEKLREELAAIRSSGIAYNRDNYCEGLSAIAAPVFDYSGKVVAAMSISVLSQSLTPKKETVFEDVIAKVTARFSRQLGYSPR